MSSAKVANKMDSVLQFVNSQFITLQEDEKKYYMKHYQCVIEKLVDIMKKENKLFEALFQNFFWAGSYYDGLKVGKPEEFDVDVVMKIPIDYDTVEFVNKKVDPPFVKVMMMAMKQLPQHPLWTDVYRGMEKWTDKDGFFLQGEFRQWMESAVNKALLSLPREGNSSRLEIDGNIYLILLKKTGPAMTLNIVMRDIKLDVDLVPVIEFKSSKKWPPEPVRKNTVPKRESWLIVPKPNSKLIHEYKDTYWRLAFHEQERDMISGNHLGHLKNACRLLKKFRDKNNFKAIASYYIKTIFLWEIYERNNDTTFWKSSLSEVFMTMLKKLAVHIKAGSIKYFWDGRYNLISGISPVVGQNIENRINKIIKEIEKKSVDDPTIIAFHLLTPEEFTKFELKYSPPAQTKTSVSAMPPPVFDTNTVPPVDKEAENENPTIETVVQMIGALQQELVHQRKLTQTILNKLINVEQSLFQLTGENAMLRDELSLVKLSSMVNEPEESNLLSFDDNNECLTSPTLTYSDSRSADVVLNNDCVDAMLIMDTDTEKENDFESLFF